MLLFLVVETQQWTLQEQRRIKGVENVRLVYRRTKRYMPADEEELREAIEDGVQFMELLAPIGVENGQLKCSVKMELGSRSLEVRCTRNRRNRRSFGRYCNRCCWRESSDGLYEAYGSVVNDRGKARFYDKHDDKCRRRLRCR